jgi:hypothetical protein
MQCCGSGSGAFEALDPGWEKIQRQDPGSWMKIPNLIFENLLTVFWVKNATLLKNPKIFLEKRTTSPSRGRGVLGR